MEAIFTGFDSAWSATKSGAICDLLLDENGLLRLCAEPVTANWDRALAHAKEEVKVDLHVWAVDQPILVRNEKGCRPVERNLASALMADFGCGAHSSNLGLAPWAEGAPIWNFIRALQEMGHQHNPMAIPGAGSGRFYFECYPHPAILGLFDLSEILKYKQRNLNDWQMLIRLLRSLASAELAIRNICSYVQEDLPQNKRNEDKLDSIISAYVAAYWWKFGVARSTSIGDLSTGYIVTPHSEKTYAAMARVFGGRMNIPGAVSALPPAVPSREEDSAGHELQNKPSFEASELRNALPVCDWVYFATTAKWSGTVTSDFVAKHKVIIRSVYNTKRIRIANVQHLKAGDRILLVHGGPGKPYRALFSAVISTSAAPVRSSQHCFDVFTYIDKALHSELEAGGYVPDQELGFTGITITETHDLRYVPTTIPRPTGNNTIWHWEEVFGH
jgi:predicted RNase H-like nuclease